jgi:hypothetical protein
MRPEDLDRRRDRERPRSFGVDGKDVEHSGIMHARRVHLRGAIVISVTGH